VASPFAAANKLPLLLTETDSLPQATLDFLTAQHTQTVYIIGGTAVVSPAVENQLKGMGITVVRLEGSDRYQTAQAATSRLAADFGMHPTLIGVAIGEDFPDALVGGASLGIRGGILVITPKAGLNGESRAVLQAYNSGLPKVEILGGINAISIGLEDEIRAVFGY